MGKNEYTAPVGEEEEDIRRLEDLSKEWPEEISHSLHKDHQLVKALRPPHTCKSCHTPGNDWSFYCATCDFDLHPECAVEAQLTESAKPWPRTVQHDIHPPHPLVKTRLDTFWCFFCGESGTWWCFCCELCEIRLHPECALGQRSTGVRGTQAMALVLAKAEKDSYWCSVCAKEGKDACYTSEALGVDLHLVCAATAAVNGCVWPTSLESELHQQHKLVREQNAGYYCNGCWSEGNGWSFACDECNFHLHPGCAVDDVSAASGWIDHMMIETKKQKVLKDLQELQLHQSTVTLEGDVDDQSSEDNDDDAEADADGGEEE